MPLVMGDHILVSLNILGTCLEHDPGYDPGYDPFLVLSLQQIATF